jgi:hypothetical protein
MLLPGDVFIYKQFAFEDGSQRDKWFVILNSPDHEKPCIVLKTTSNSARYQGCVKGCNKHLRCFFAPATWQTCFRVDTYIQLPQIIEFSTDTLYRESIARRIEFRPSPLSSDCFGQLKSCLAGFKDDISPSHWALIYKTKS